MRLSSPENPLSIEMIRWTFTVSPARPVEIETYFLDLGLEIQARGDDVLVVTWDEPEGGIHELIERSGRSTPSHSRPPTKDFTGSTCWSITPRRPKRSTAMGLKSARRHRVDPPDRARRPSRRFALRRRAGEIGSPVYSRTGRFRWSRT